MKALYRHLAVTTVPLLVLTGCAGIGSISGSDTLSVRSTPSDATVFVMDRTVGRTPLELKQQTLYPNTYSQDKAHLYGVITIRKSGCQDFTKRISSSNIARGVDAQLECGDSSTDSKAASTKPASAPESNSKESIPITQEPVTSTPETATATESSAKQRLLRINQLRQEGLITEQEYQAIRQRILDSL